MVSACWRSCDSTGTPSRTARSRMKRATSSPTSASAFSRLLGPRRRVLQRRSSGCRPRRSIAPVHRAHFGSDVRGTARSTMTGAAGALEHRRHVLPVKGAPARTSAHHHVRGCEQREQLLEGPRGAAHLGGQRLGAGQRAVDHHQRAPLPPAGMPRGQRRHLARAHHQHRPSASPSQALLASATAAWPWTSPPCQWPSPCVPAWRIGRPPRTCATPRRAPCPPLGRARRRPSPAPALRLAHHHGVQAGGHPEQVLSAASPWCS